MKKSVITSLLVVSIFTGLLDAAPAWWNNMTNKLRSVPGGIARKWHCVKNPDHYNCTPQERASAKIWITGATAVTIAAVLALVGIKMAASEVKQVQDKAVELPRYTPDQANILLLQGIYAHNLNQVKIALDSGANVNFRSAVGWSALEEAANRDNLEMVYLLLERGAFPALTNDVAAAIRIKAAILVYKLNQLRRDKDRMAKSQIKLRQEIDRLSQGGNKNMLRSKTGDLARLNDQAKRISTQIKDVQGQLSRVINR